MSVRHDPMLGKPPGRVVAFWAMTGLLTLAIPSDGWHIIPVFLAVTAGIGS